MNIEEAERKQHVCAVLLKENNIHILRRSVNQHESPNLYEFPGGEVNLGETHYEALQRHLLNSLSINVDINNMYAFQNNVIEFDGKIINVMLIRHWDNIITLNDKFHNKELEITVEELKEFRDMARPYKEAVPAIIDFLNIPYP